MGKKRLEKEDSLRRFFYGSRIHPSSETEIW
jgi:hypothetical protein